MSFEEPEKRDSLGNDDDVSRPSTGRRKSSMSRRKNSQYEDPFARKESVDEGEIQDAEIDYQSLEWWQASMSMSKPQELLIKLLTAVSHDRRDNLAGNSLAAVGARESRSRAWTHIDCWTGHCRNLYWLGMSFVQTTMKIVAASSQDSKGYWTIPYEVSLGK